MDVWACATLSTSDHAGGHHAVAFGSRGDRQGSEPEASRDTAPEPANQFPTGLIQSVNPGPFPCREGTGAGKLVPYFALMTYGIQPSSPSAG